MRDMFPVGSNNSCGAAVILEQASEPLTTCNGVAGLSEFIACPPQKFDPPSCSLLLQPVYVMQTAESRCRGNSVTDWQLVSVWTCRNLGLEWLRDSRPKRGMRASPIEISNEFTKDSLQMTFAERDQEIETLATNSPDEPFAESVRLRSANRSFQHTDAKAPELIVQSERKD
jgi:hypothetical protein